MDYSLQVGRYMPKMNSIILIYSKKLVKKAISFINENTKIITCSNYVLPLLKETEAPFSTLQDYFPEPFNFSEITREWMDKTLMETKCRLGGKIGILETSQDTSIEIDETDDWKVVEQLLLTKQRNELTRILMQIKLLAIDVDGTLTDGGMYYSDQGELLKKFNTRDAKGIELIQEKGIEVILITSEDSQIVNACASKLQLKHVFLGIKDKMDVIQEFCTNNKIKYSEVAYIGDDVNDLQVLMGVSFSACLADAVPIVKEKSLYICQKKGGDGVVREVCNLILDTFT